MTIDAFKRAGRFLKDNVPLSAALVILAANVTRVHEASSWFGWLISFIAKPLYLLLLVCLIILATALNERLVSRRRYFAAVAATELKREMTIDIGAQITAAMAPVVQQIDFLLEFENNKRKWAAVNEMAGQGYFDPNYRLKNPATMDHAEQMKRLKRTLDRHGITVDITGLRPERVNGLETHLFTSLASNWM
jgi:hypothetical protein